MRGICSTVERADDSYTLAVRGSCCFHHKTVPQVEQPGEHYCTTCPLLDPALRRTRHDALLDGHVLPRRAEVLAGR